MCVCEIERLLFSWVMRPWQRFVSLSVLKLADVSDCARETANRRAEERGLEEREKKKKMPRLRPSSASFKTARTWQS